MNAAVSDLRQSIRLLPLALHFAWGDTKARYRRSVLGPLWIVLGTAIGVTGLGYLWSIILQTDPATLVPSLTIGLVVWQLITGAIVESSTVFARGSQIIKNIRTPYIIFPIQLVIKNLINFAHNLIIVVVVVALYHSSWSISQLLFIPGLFLVAINLVWISLLMGMVGARFRDLEPLVSAILPMIFFLTPVIYRPENLPISQWFTWLNPLAYFIQAVRDPIQNVKSSLSTFGWLILMAGMGWALALWVLNSRYKRLAFWL